jgi:hypothetical protein
MPQYTHPLSLFKEQLENQCGTIMDENGLENRGDGLIWWYFKELKGYNLNKIDQIYCDGGGDLGIDAVDRDDDNYIHIYQFKNFEALEKDYPGTTIDSVLSGLSLIFSNNYQEIANEDLKNRIEDIRQRAPYKYILHLVMSSIGCLTGESIAKIKEFSLRYNINDIFDFELENLDHLWDAFYSKKLKTIEDSISITFEHPPYPILSSNHGSYVLYLKGSYLAELYDEYGEKLLQQNIRVSVGNKPTNKAIEYTCTGTDSGNFFHYNNGITFLCESAKPPDPILRTFTLDCPQVVNGGQTIRVLHKAFKEGKLKDDVRVLVRVISSEGDKDFANNVAVNLNNQTKVDPSFLKSNEPRVIQLYNSILTLGWYLERREGEINQLSEEEREALEHSIGFSLENRVIPLKSGAQSYVATYLGQLELASKNPKKIFQDPQDGGLFNRIFNDEISALKFLNSYRLFSAVDNFVDAFTKIKRRKSRLANWRTNYSNLLGNELVQQYGDKLDQIIPQSSLFLCALIYWKFIVSEGRPIEDIIGKIESDYEIQINILKNIIEFYEIQPDRTGKALSSLLKTQNFLESIKPYIRDQTNT